MLSGNILITGGSGFLGRAILHRAARENWPARFTIYSRHEDALYRLPHLFPQLNIRCVTGSICNLDRLATAMAGHDTVIHAAAVKFVPEAEYNVLETVEINVQGSINVALAARIAGVMRVIGVSTDKACLPVNLYGATKMIMERTFSEADTWGGPHFICTRYGNVIGSTGSIVPVFRRQLEQYGCVKITDPEMTRFWLRPSDAVDLIVAASRMIDEFAGSIIVPRPKAAWIDDVARAVAGEARIEIIGARPGEKRHEALISDYEAARTLRCDDLMVVLPAVTKVDPAIVGLKGGYFSDMPDGWLAPDELADMIREAESV